MTTPHSPATNAAVRRSPRRRRPGPFPVTVTRPTTTIAELTPAQRNRRHIADQEAAELTAAARHGSRPLLHAARSTPIDNIPRASHIIATAAALAANPAPGALRIGRDLRGRPVAVVLHAATWSLLIRPARAGRTASSWAYLDADPDGVGWERVPRLGLCFDDEPTVAGVEWTDMLAAVLTCVS